MQCNAMQWYCVICPNLLSLHNFRTMSIIELIKSSKSRRPHQIGDFCRRCYTLSATHKYILHPMTVIEITIPIVGLNTEPRLFQVFNHLVEKPWRVLNKFIYLTRHSTYISIYLVCPIQRTLKAGEEICHVAFVQPEEALFDIKGNIVY